MARLLLVTAFIASAVLVVPSLMREPLGFRDAAWFLEACGEIAGRTMMVISDEQGETAFVAEVAGQHPVPAATVIRASKLMASDDWSGHAFRLRYPSAGALMRDLEDLHVDYVIVDASLEAARHPLWPQTRELLDRQADRLEQTHAVTAARTLMIYRLKYWSAGPAKPLQLTISRPFAQLLSR